MSAVTPPRNEAPSRGSTPRVFVQLPSLSPFQKKLALAKEWVEQVNTFAISGSAEDTERVYDLAKICPIDDTFPEPVRLLAKKVMSMAATRVYDPSVIPSSEEALRSMSSQRHVTLLRDPHPPVARRLFSPVNPSN